MADETTGISGDPNFEWQQLSEGVCGGGGIVEGGEEQVERADPERQCGIFN